MSQNEGHRYQLEDMEIDCAFVWQNSKDELCIMDGSGKIKKMNMFLRNMYANKKEPWIVARKEQYGRESLQADNR